MKQNKWTQQLHDKLAEHKTTPPEGLWSDIEAVLEAQPKARKSRFIILHRWAVAASLAALVVGGAYLFLGDEEANIQENVQQIVKTDVHKDQTDISPQDEEPETTVVDVPCLLRLKMQIAEQVAEQVASLDTTTTPTAIPEEPVVTQSVEQHHSEPPVTEHYSPFTSHHSQVTTHHSSLTLKLYAANGLSAYMGHNGVLMADALAQNYIDTYSAGDYRRAAKKEIYLVGYEERQHHYQPISFGLNVSYTLTSRLALSAGINYTKMRSDFSQIIKTQEIRRKQTLHYIGIPVSASFLLWKYKNTRVYMAAGAEADWNIKTHLETEGVTQPLNRDRMQWSVRGSLGVEYDIIPQLGLYVEPGVAHYFDNGSNIQNYWKDKPTNLNLQMGIRLMLKP